MTMDQDIQEVLISKEVIKEKTAEVAAEISEEYREKNPLIVGVLKGALPFMADLMKELDIFLEYDMMDVSSYGSGLTSSGEVKIVKDLDTPLEGRDVIIVEDIVDTGRTLKYLKEMFFHRNAKSVKIVTLLDKPSGRVVELEADWSCFTIKDAFVVGYGLDYRENYRNLPYVGVLKEEIYY